MQTPSFITKDFIGRAIMLGLLALLAAMFYLATTEPKTTSAQGSYEMVEIMSEMWDVNAPCYNSGNCNFSCGPATAGRGCYANICSGLGNGDSAYLTHSEYVCTYYPPATCSAGQIGTPPNCRYPTCADDPTLNGCACSATNACGQTNYGSYSGGSCNVGAPALPGGYGTSCSASNSCGSATNYGTIQCNGSCSASAPSEASCAPDEPTGPTCQELDISLWGDYPPNCYFPSCQDLGYDAGTPPNGCYNNPEPPTCTPDHSCAATTCAGSYCSDGCSGSVPGVMDCPVGGGGDGGDGGDGGGGSCTDSGPIDLTATPSRVVAGSDTVISIEWTVDETADTSCTLTNVNTNTDVDSSAVSPSPSCSSSGEYEVSNLAAQTTFRLTCGTLEKDVIVNMVPRFEEF